MSVKHKAEFGLIEKIATSGKGITIQGWANKAIVDRGGDIIPKSAWQLDNFHKNPIVLFNHDKSKPIGKVTAVEARDEGLYVKARISGSSDPEITKIRDLIDEGVLNAFSVGFDMIDSEASDKGVTEIKAAELFELSVVALPMNQDSLFSVAKCYDYDSVKSYFKAHDGLTSKAAEKPAPDAAAAEGEDDANADSSSTEDEQSGKADKAEAEKMELEVQALTFPKADFKDEASVQEWAVANGWEAEALTDDGDVWTLTLKPVEEFTNVVDLPLDNGVTAKVGVCKPAPEPMEGEDAVEDGKTKAAEAPAEGEQPTEALPKQPPETDGNETLLLARQTNVLLGQLVAEIQAVKQAIVDLSNNQPPKAAPVEVPADKTDSDSEALAKTTSLVREYLKSVRDIYERIGA